MASRIESKSPPRVTKLRRRLRAWGKKKMKRYPWRYKSSPYKVITAEFMLHRTQAVQVQQVYDNFIRVFPTLSDYIKGNKTRIRKLLKPLGLVWRVNAMMKALIVLWKLYGEIPTDFDKLVEVPGIGQYIAGATICFTRNKVVTLVDTNSVRVIGRVFGLRLQGEARRRKDVIEAIGKTCDPRAPRDFYYALIDLAHMICTPSNPLCAQCPLLNVPCEFGQGVTLRIED